jgi:short subunit dehydrogenase-like uncharacterized protein
MTGKLIIYGTTGYTGHLVSKLAKQAGLDFIVAGCDAEKARPVWASSTSSSKAPSAIPTELAPCISGRSCSTAW